jgi:hypothetical protein
LIVAEESSLEKKLATAQIRLMIEQIEKYCKFELENIAPKLNN